MDRTHRSFKEILPFTIPLGLIAGLIIELVRAAVAYELTTSYLMFLVGDIFLIIGLVLIYLFWKNKKNEERSANESEPPNINVNESLPQEPIERMGETSRVAEASTDPKSFDFFFMIGKIKCYGFPPCFSCRHRIDQPFENFKKELLGYQAYCDDFVEGIMKIMDAEHNFIGDALFPHFNDHYFRTSALTIIDPTNCPGFIPIPESLFLDRVVNSNGHPIILGPLIYKGNFD
jgi:hypothetical protein